MTRRKTDTPIKRELSQTPGAIMTRNRREDLRTRGLCVNGEKHGPAVKGGRCGPCWEAKKAGLPRSNFTAILYDLTSPPTHG